MSRNGITKQDNGKFRAFVDCGYDYEGRRIRKSKTCKTEREAVLWQAEMRVNSQKIDMRNMDIIFCDMAKKWRLSKVERNITTGTLCKYENAIRIVKDYPHPFYEKKARDIKKTDVESLLNYLAFEKHLSLNYITDIKQIVSAIFTFGVDNDMIFKNPCKKADLPNIKMKKSEKDSFTPEEIDIIENNYKSIEFGDIVYTLINTGMRSQEICAIDDKSLITDEAGNRYIHVENAMKRNRSGGWDLGVTKTENSVRDIPINNEIYLALMKRIMSNKDHFLLPGRNHGKYLSYDNFKKHYNRFFDGLNAISDKKVRKLPPHCCRHTFNSRLIWAHVSPFVIQALLGHATVEMTDDYAHIMHEHLVSAISEIQAM